MPLCGGIGEAKPADEEIQMLVTQMRKHVETKANKQFDDFTAIAYSTQVVAGTNFFVKVHVGNDECVHVRIFRPLPHENRMPEVHSYELPKTREDPITYF